MHDVTRYVMSELASERASEKGEGVLKSYYSLV